MTLKIDSSWKVHIQLNLGINLSQWSLILAKENPQSLGLIPFLKNNDSSHSRTIFRKESNFLKYI
ncbi:hypothetical protein DQM68_15295 [Leptospira mayottensis]|nr:hypothetical protein DQM68_15295 [Leptospira mayottensis]AZQ01711.1 hypothetical protein LEP1GSC190_06425 [Leptospira mayottensis 200901116]